MRKKQIKAPLPISATIEKMSHDGRGIARLNGKTTFIDGALAEEVVTFQYTRQKRDFDEGKVISIEKPSDLRVEPSCPHYGVCGGCSLQHLDAHAQIQLKQEILLEVLRKMAHVEPQEILSPLTSQHWNYRNKARLSVRYVAKKNTALVGFREKYQPRYIAEIKTCSILNQQISNQLEFLCALINKMEDPHTIAQIEVAAGDHKIAFIVRNLSALSPSDELLWIDYAKNTGIHILLQPAGPDSVYPLYPQEEDAVWLEYSLPDEGVKFKFHPTDFTQVNANINRLMVRKAMQLLEIAPGERILDLFCGLGNFSLPMANLGAFVVGVEGSEAMVGRARDNACLNNLENTTFMCANLENENSLELFPGPFTKVLLDPPRTGALTIVKNIEKINPERIVYVSCNPITLARDTAVLIQEKGYHLISAGVMDMFPHTSHVESIALFVKK